MTTRFLKSSILLLTLLWASSPAQAYPYTILVWGDSLSAAYGIPPEQGWVSLLGDRLNDRFSGQDIQVENGSVSGEITYGGAERISQALGNTIPDLVILALGSNDGLQGMDLAQIRQNLTKIIQSAQGAGADVLLLGMKIPPNYGSVYANEFHNIFTELASRFEIGFVPFFLEPVALDFDLVLPDGFHPNESAQPILLDHIWPAVLSFLPGMN